MSIRNRSSVITLVTAIALLAGVAVFNFSIDANSIFIDLRFWKKDPIATYVDRMLKSSDGVRYSAREREIKAMLAQKTSADCYVIGSSLVMIVNKSTFPLLADQCQAAINLGVSSAALEDVTMYAGLVGQKPTTKLVMLGVDPWAFKLNQDRRWRTTERAFWQARQAIGLPVRADLGDGADTANVFRLFSLTYLNRNWQVARSPKHKAEIDNRDAPADHGEDAPDYMRFMSDGTLHYPRQAHDQDPMRPLPDGGTRIDMPFTEPLAVEEWRQTITWLKAKGIRVVLIMAPYNPRIWACANPMICNGLEAAELAARNLAAELHVEILGSYNPQPFGFTPKDYIDERHLWPEAIGRLSPSTTATDGH